MRLGDLVRFKRSLVELALIHGGMKIYATSDALQTPFLVMYF